jgi:hypothetical protein
MHLLQELVRLRLLGEFKVSKVWVIGGKAGKLWRWQARRSSELGIRWALDDGLFRVPACPRIPPDEIQGTWSLRFVSS